MYSLCLFIGCGEHTLGSKSRVFTSGPTTHNPTSEKTHYKYPDTFNIPHVPLSAPVTDYSRCRYTHDVSEDAIFWYMEGDEWRCGHPAREGDEYCLFHRPLSEKNDEDVVERFLSVVTSRYDGWEIPTRERLRFIGAEFGDFSLPLFATIVAAGDSDPTAADCPIDLREIRVDGVLHWAQTTVRHDLLLDGATVDGEVDFSAATVQGDYQFSRGYCQSLVRLADIEIEGSCTFSDGTFQRAISLHGSEIGGRLSVRDARIGSTEVTDSDTDEGLIQVGEIVVAESRLLEDVDMTGVRVTGKLAARDVHVSGDVGFDDAHIGGHVVFDGSNILGDLSFERARLAGHAVFRYGTVIGGETTLNRTAIGGHVVFEDANIEGNVQCMKAEFEGDAAFDSANIGGTAAFGETTVDGHVEFNEARIGRLMDFHEVTVGGNAAFYEASIGDDVLFWGATVAGDLSFTDARISGRVACRETNVDGDIRFGRANIEGDLAFDRATIDGNGGFEESIIAGDARFGKATIAGDATFERATVSRDIRFGQTTVEGDLTFADATVGRDAAFAKTRIRGRSDFAGLAVGDALTIGFDAVNEAHPVMRFTDGVFDTVHIAGYSPTAVLDFGESQIQRIEVPDGIDDADHTWSFTGVRFDNADFTALRDFFESLRWILHRQNSRTREKLALEATHEDADRHATHVTEALVSVPSVAAAVRAGEIAVTDAPEFVTALAETVFEDHSVVSKVVSGTATPSDIRADPAVGEIGIDDGRYRAREADLIRQLGAVVVDDARFATAVDTDRASSVLEEIARMIDDADIEVGTDIDESPYQQIDSESLPIEELRLAFNEAYADPESFRVRNNPEVWERTYRNVRTAASDAGANEIAAEFFYRELLFRRKRHARQFVASGSLRKRLVGGWNWFANSTMWLTTGYGERPRNVVASSVAIVALFAGVFHLLEAFGSEGSLLESTIFSVQAFIALIIGTTPSGSVLVRLASAVEGFLGAFLIALFVFTLTRSLNR